MPVFTTWSKRCEEFGVEKDESIVIAANKHLREGKLSAIEFSFMSGLVTSLKDTEGAKASLNDVIAKVDSSGLTQNDVHLGLWAFVRLQTGYGPR